MRGNAIAPAVVLAVSASFAVRAFVGLAGNSQPSLHAAREVAVATRGREKQAFTSGEWNPNKKEPEVEEEEPLIAMGRTIEALRKRTDDELHQKITDSRKDLWEGRLDVFRRKPPNPEQKYRNKKTIARAKTVLAERRLDREEEESQARRDELAAAVPLSKRNFARYLKREGPVMTATRDMDESLNAMQAFSQRGGKRQQNKKYGDATPSTFKRADWYYISPEEREQMAEALKARRDQGEWKTLVEDTREAFKHTWKEDYRSGHGSRRRARQKQPEETPA